MKSKRFSVRFDLDVKDEADNWRYIHEQSEPYVNTAIQKAITSARLKEEIRDTVYRAVTDALRDSSYKPVENQIQQTENEDIVLDFLDMF